MEVPEGDIQREKILEEYQDDPYASESTKLERDYLSGRLGYGDRMRLSDSDGNLFDVILYPDGSIGIQELALKIDFGRTTKFQTWEEASEAIPQKYDLVRHIEAHVTGCIGALIKRLSETKKNPYKK